MAESLREQAIKAMAKRLIDDDEGNYNEAFLPLAYAHAVDALDGLLDWLRENTNEIHAASGYPPVTREVIQPSQVRVLTDLLSDR